MTDTLSIIATVSIIAAAGVIAIGGLGPSFGQARAISQALQSIAEQPDMSNVITRTLFVGLAMLETASIYAFVIAMILIFANPFWNTMLRLTQ